jgi:hypothetical protein
VLRDVGRAAHAELFEGGGVEGADRRADVLEVLLAPLSRDDNLGKPSAVRRAAGGSIGGTGIGSVSQRRPCNKPDRNRT